jgi:hypothetical protein
MKATISKIDDEKLGQSRQPFVRVHFMPATGGWMKMDLCPTHRNYRKWEPHLEIGASFSNLRLKDAKTIDGDSNFTRDN